MKWIIFLLIAFLVLGCSESDKEVVINVLPFGEVPDDNYEGEYPDGSFDIKHNPQTGSIALYRSNYDDMSIAFEESIGYPYGFDRSTAGDISPEKDRFVYISTKNGEDASFMPVLSKKLFNEYQLIEETSSSIIPLFDGQTAYLPAGDYILYGHNGIRWENLDKHIKVISYTPKPKYIYYVQLDGDGWNTENDKNSFTIERVTQAFNNVYRQVVLEPHFIPQDLSFYNQPDVNLDLSALLQINMVNRNNLIISYVYKQAEEMVLSQLEGKDIKKIDINSIIGRHIVVAINKALKFWPLKSVYGNSGNLIDLKNNYKFNPENEPSGTTYAIQSIGECEDGVGKNAINVTIRKSITEYGEEQLFAYHNGEKVTFGPCDYIFTTNGFPVIPYIDPETFAISFPFKKEGFIFGSIIWVPRGGEMNFDVMMHELGHSFGLADVSRNDVYNSTVSSTETNLMSWAFPNGKRLRYRNQQVVYTGGDINNNESPVENVFENQWACLRDECDSYDRWDNSNPIMKYWCDLFAEKCL